MTGAYRINICGSSPLEPSDHHAAKARSRCRYGSLGRLKVSVAVTLPSVVGAGFMG
jgi:hypothetical protein